MGLASGLPHALPAAIFVAVHTSPDSFGFLPSILSKAGPLPAAFASDGERITLGRFYVAPPDRHLLVANGTVKVTRGPHENGFRPAADPLFRTAARTHGPRVIGIILSGGLNDGTHGLELVKRHGGVAIAQHIDEALVPGMPLTAIQNVKVDHILRVREMPAVITRLVNQTDAGEGKAMTRTNRSRPDPAEKGTHGLEDEKPDGPLSPFTCPECGGSLWESKADSVVRFSCHVGHSFTAEILVASQDDGVEGALWSALRALEEKAALRRRMAVHARRSHHFPLADNYDKHAEESERQANLVRAVLTQDHGRPPGTEAVSQGGRRRGSKGVRSRAARAARRKR
jgi:two-component system chemotaxis response regulator CheB